MSETSRAAEKLAQQDRRPSEEPKPRRAWIGERLEKERDEPRQSGHTKPKGEDDAGSDE